MLRRFLTGVLATLGSILSLVGVVISLKPDDGPFTGWQVAALFTAGVLGVVAVGSEGAVLAKQLRRRMKTDRRIAGYMKRWVANEGRVVVFTNDMSWADHGDVQQALLRKAQAGDLRICAPKPSERVGQLMAQGAKVSYYDQVNFVPQSRFTIIRHGRSDSVVAIGRNVDGVHVIEEFAVGAHPAYALASDLVDLVERLPEP